MVYRRASGNIRKPRRRARRTMTRRRVYRRRTIRRTTRRTSSCPQELSPAAKFALAQLDPFESRAVGAKIPDSNTMPSIANTDADSVRMTVPAASGNLLATAFKPGYTESYLHALDNNGALSVAWTGTWNGRRNLGSVTSTIEAIRPVAHAVRISSPLAPTTASGFVHMGIAVESRRSHRTAAGPDYPTTPEEMSGLQHYRRVTVASLTQSPITIINKWLDETGFRYEDPRVVNNYVSSAGTVYTSQLNFDTSWGVLIVMVEGNNQVASPLSFEHLLMSECIPQKNAFILGTPAAPNSPGTMSAVSSMTAAQDFSHTEAGQESYISAGLEELSRGAQNAGERVWNDVALPVLSRLGHMAGNQAMNMALGAIAGRGGLPGVNSNPNRLTSS